MTTRRDLAPEVTFAWWETLCMRIGFALLLCHEYPPATRLPPPGSELPFPNGLAQWLDLGWGLVPQVYTGLHAALLAAAALYASGVAFPLAAPLLLVCYLVPATLLNSSGAISHHYQLMTLLLLAQTLAAWAWCLGRGRAAALWSSPAALHSWTTRVSLQVVAGNYVLSALTKLVATHGTWIWATHLMPVQFEKTRWQLFHDRLSMPELPLGAALNDACLAHPWICPLFFGPGLLIELFAFAMLFGRRWALLLGAAIALMHELVAATMGLFFRPHAAIAIIYAVNAPYWSARATRRARGARARTDSRPATAYSRTARTTRS
jgi:hypothetical protein